MIEAKTIDLDARIRTVRQLWGSRSEVATFAAGAVRSIARRDQAAILAKERVTRTFTMAEAAKELHKSRRWLQDWLRDHPADSSGIPFYAPMGAPRPLTKMI